MTIHLSLENTGDFFTLAPSLFNTSSLSIFLSVFPFPICCLLLSPLFSDFLYVYVCLYFWMCVCIHVYVCTCPCSCVYVCAYLCMCLCIWLSACVRVCAFVYMCVCMHVCVCVCFFSPARWEGHAGWWVHLWPFPLPAAALWRTQLRCVCRFFSI